MRIPFYLNIIKITYFFLSAMKALGTLEFIESVFKITLLVNKSKKGLHLYPHTLT